MQNFESADETSQDEPSKEESEQPRVPTFSLEDVEKEKLKVQQAMQSQINALERELRCVQISLESESACSNRLHLQNEVPLSLSPVDDFL